MSSSQRIVAPKSTVGRLFRESFTFGHKELTHWFPSHMARGMKKMQAMLRKVDCVIEVHDARIPFTGRNMMFRNLLGIKPHLLVLNKMDLMDSSKKTVVKAVVDIVNQSERYHRAEADDYNLMVVGIPNVGKSSVINAMRRMHLRKGKGTRVGGLPGITRGVMDNIQVSNRPKIFLVDTPGIMTPYIPGVDDGMKLALCGTLQDHKVGQEIIADYLLFWLNKNSRFEYVDVFGLDQPSDDIIFVLTHLAKTLGKMQRVRALDGTRTIQPNHDAAASHMLRCFRTGQLGKFVLDLQ
ncbi:mitochondrial ribosome-associated GTPase 1-like isoform X2 [Ptychodera flava]|uniref:mitochondrial ribosome-associated GTPase 1-like isoform X2 n=1 Tax=Ptychodera flava TaxID=63121 RepID=UPI00396A7210